MPRNVLIFSAWTLCFSVSACRASRSASSCSWASSLRSISAWAWIAKIRIWVMCSRSTPRAATLIAVSTIDSVSGGNLSPRTSVTASRMIVLKLSTLIWDTNNDPISLVSTVRIAVEEWFCLSIDVSKCVSIAYVKLNNVTKSPVKIIFFIKTSPE